MKKILYLFLVSLISNISSGQSIAYRFDYPIGNKGFVGSNISPVSEGITNERNNDLVDL